MHSTQAYISDSVDFTKYFFTKYFTLNTFWKKVLVLNTLLISVFSTYEFYKKYLVKKK